MGPERAGDAPCDRGGTETAQRVGRRRQSVCEWELGPDAARPGRSHLSRMDRKRRQNGSAGAPERIFAENPRVAKLNKTILIVDDEADALGILRDILLQDGYNVKTAFGGEEAFSLLEKETVDLLITDRAMPGLGGLELL